MDLRNIEKRNIEANQTKSKKMKTWKISLGALILTTIITSIAVNATDNIGNFSSSLLGTVVKSDKSQELCPADMAYVSSPNGGFCIDKYEASASSLCIHNNPKNGNESSANLNIKNCVPSSVLGAVPWTNVARHQAELACSKVGKHLPSNEEWYRASLGTPDALGNVKRGDCNLNGRDPALSTGSKSLCVSNSGAFDMVGNVWEWVGEMVTNGEFRGNVLPEEGFVSAIDINGVPIATNATTSDSSFNDDYLFVDHSGSRGMFRGGYWGSDTDGGQYAVNVITPPSFTGNAVGFRCAK